MDYWRCLLLPVHPTDAKRVVNHLIGYRNLSSISGKSIRNNTANKRACTWLFYCCTSFKFICNYRYMVQKDNLLLSVRVHISLTKISLFPSLYCILSEMLHWHWKGFPSAKYVKTQLWWNRLVNTITEDIVDIRSSRVTDYGRSWDVGSNVGKERHSGITTILYTWMFFSSSLQSLDLTLDKRLSPLGRFF